MKKFLPGLAAFAGVVSMPLSVSHPPIPTVPVAHYRTDTRIEKLHSFFQKFDCPAVSHVMEFLDAADVYDLDWRLLPSISYVESTGGKLARNNNLFGWDSGRAQFASISSAIYDVGYRLAYSRLYKHKDLDALLATYNPDTDYADKVKSVMRRIAPCE